MYMMKYKYTSAFACTAAHACIVPTRAMTCTFTLMFTWTFMLATLIRGSVTGVGWAGRCVGGRVERGG